MRKVVVANLVSLDGSYTGADGDVMAMPFDQSFNAFNVERLRSATTLLTGRTSFEGFRSYWPDVVDDPDVTEAERETSRLNNAIEKVVISDTLTLDPAEPWGDARVVRRQDAHAEVAALKAQEGGDILVFGSHTLWNDLLEHGLVDELHLTIGAGIVNGKPAFTGDPGVTLRLLEPPRVFEEADNIIVRYAVEPRQR